MAADSSAGVSSPSRKSVSRSATVAQFIRGEGLCELRSRRLREVHDVDVAGNIGGIDSGLAGAASDEAADDDHGVDDDEGPCEQLRARHGPTEDRDIGVEPTGGACLKVTDTEVCLLYTSPSPRDRTRSRMPSSA